MLLEATPATAASIDHPAVRALLAELHRRARGDLLRLPAKLPRVALDLLRGRTLMQSFGDGAAKDLFLTISPEQGRFLYLVGRTVAARRVVEFGTSFGVSTLYLAAAVTDNGGGRVIGSELEPGKHEVAVENLARAGFDAVAEVRLGDAMTTLADVEGPIDLVLLDGWKDLYLPMLRLLRPKLRRGSVVLADNIFTFKKSLRPFLDYLRSPENGFQSTTLSISDGFEYSVYVGPSLKAPSTEAAPSSDLGG
jgi:predicted O-methyltransferase YrrM